LLERGIFGGQIVNARLVENYPGFPEGISGPELGEFMRRQATKYELETLTTEVTGVRTGNTYEVSTREVAVVGGGDTAITDALELAQHCRKVYIIHRRDQLRATKALQEKTFSQAKIELVWNTVVHEIVGDKMLRSLSLRNVKTGQLSDLEVDGIFVAVGIKPNSQVFSQLVTLDEAGFIVTDELMRTPAPGARGARTRR